jgi:hypothetical protein
METGKNHTNKGTQLINIYDKLITNQQPTANSFNTYFLTIANKMDCNIKNYKTSLNSNNPIHCLHKNFKLTFTNIKIKYTTTKEIKEIIKSLKSKNSHGYDKIPIKIL